MPLKTPGHFCDVQTIFPNYHTPIVKLVGLHCNGRMCGDARAQFRLLQISADTLEHRKQRPPTHSPQAFKDS
jgi:hypothetical protein